MKILMLGGTGAMGTPLIELLAKDSDNIIYVTSRSKKEDLDNVKYICGNAKQIDFLMTILDQEYDAIIDFLVYESSELRERIDIFLDHTKQYFFFSSARCYAASVERLTEDSPRLIDVCDDKEYLSTDEYALAKGREEDILRFSGKKNWTIIRPYITYNAYRLQLGVYEKENWLRRALAGRTIVMPSDIASKKTSLTFGGDVAGIIASLIGNEKALGEIFHLTTSETHTWNEILLYYSDIIEKKTGKKIKIKYVDDSLGLQKVWNPWQIKYDRLFDRSFDNNKIESVIGKCEFTPTYEGLQSCLNIFLDNPKWLHDNWHYEAWCDRLTGEVTPLKEVKGKKNKLLYLKWRFGRN